MSSSRTITLFSERPELTQRPSSFVVSILAHAAVAALVSFGIIYTPELNDRIVPRHFTVRHLDLHSPDEKPRLSASKGIAYPGPHATIHQPAPGLKRAEQVAVLRQTADARLGIQTLVQPDIQEPVKLTEETPVPTVVIWSPKRKR